jgi:hypothetical protein
MPEMPSSERAGYSLVTELVYALLEYYLRHRLQKGIMLRYLFIDTYPVNRKCCRDICHLRGNGYRLNILLKYAYDHFFDL